MGDSPTDAKQGLSSCNSLSAKRIQPTYEWAFLTVVICFLAAGFMNKLHALDLNVGVMASRVAENHHGPWRNVRLHLTFTLSDRMELPCASPGHDYRFFASLWDHIVVQDLDDPDDKGRCIPRYGVEEYPHDDDGQIGHMEYSEEVNCVAREHCLDPDVECDSVVVDYSWVADAVVYITLPSCGRFRVHYLLDGKEWSRFCIGEVDTPGVAEIRTIIIGSSRINGGCAKVDSNLLAYIYSLEPWQKSFADIDMGDCPEPPPPPGDATAEFLGYIKPNGSDGRDWFPSPGDSIGLVFRVNMNLSQNVIHTDQDAG